MKGMPALGSFLKFLQLSWCLSPCEQSLSPGSRWQQRAVAQHSQAPGAAFPHPEIQPPPETSRPFPRAGNTQRAAEPVPVPWGEEKPGWTEVGSLLPCHKPSLHPKELFADEFSPFSGWTQGVPVAQPLFFSQLLS